MIQSVPLVALALVVIGASAAETNLAVEPGKKNTAGTCIMQKASVKTQHLVEEESEETENASTAEAASLQEEVAECNWCLFHTGCKKTSLTKCEVEGGIWHSHKADAVFKNEVAEFRNLAAVDFNEDGKISWGEVRKFLQAMGQKPSDDAVTELKKKFETVKPSLAQLNMTLVHDKTEKFFSIIAVVVAKAVVKYAAKKLVSTGVRYALRAGARAVGRAAQRHLSHGARRALSRGARYAGRGYRHYKRGRRHYNKAKRYYNKANRHYNRYTNFRYNVMRGREPSRVLWYSGSHHGCRTAHGQCYWSSEAAAKRHCSSWQACQALYCTARHNNGRYVCYARHSGHWKYEGGDTRGFQKVR